MSNFDTQQEHEDTALEHETACEKSKTAFRYLVKRFLLILSFGPGVLGFLWLLGRIVRR